MNIRRLLCAIAVTVLGLGCFGINAESAQSLENPPANFVVVYYFHGHFRCANCLKIEKYTKETVEQYFKKELDSGRVVFRVVNVDEKQNEHFVNDYQLYTKSVVLSLVKGGQETESANLTKIWEYLPDKQRFAEYVKRKIELYLKKL